jgi:hypothetical protein
VEGTAIMSRALTILLALLVVVVGLDVGAATVCSYHDAWTKQQLLKVVARELPPQWSADEMEYFMRRHTVRYASPSAFQHEYGGFIRQTKLDQFLLDRDVKIVLKVSEANTLQGADVEIFYTFL